MSSCLGEDHLAVSRPKGINPNKAQSIYVLDQVTGVISLQKVHFGNFLDEDKVEIKSGLKENQVLVKASRLPLTNKRYVLL